MQHAAGILLHTAVEAVAVVVAAVEAAAVEAVAVEAATVEAATVYAVAAVVVEDGATENIWPAVSRHLIEIYNKYSPAGSSLPVEAVLHLDDVVVAAVEAVAAVAAVDVAAAAAVEVRRVRGRPEVVSVPQRARVRPLLFVVP